MPPLWAWLGIAFLAWCAVSVPAGLLFGWWLRRCREAAETQEPPARQETSPPAAPGTRQPRIHPRHGRHLLTARYYASGAVVVWDGHGRKIAEVAEVAEEIPSDGEWDEWLKGLTQ